MNEEMNNFINHLENLLKKNNNNIININKKDIEKAIKLLKENYRINNRILKDLYKNSFWMNASKNELLKAKRFINLDKAIQIIKGENR